MIDGGGAAYHVYLGGGNEWYQFEDVCAKILQRHGFWVEPTRKSRDGGYDLIIRSGKHKVLGECKHQAKPVGRQIVDRLAGVVSAEGYGRAEVKDTRQAA